MNLGDIARNRLLTLFIAALFAVFAVPQLALAQPAGSAPPPSESSAVAPAQSAQSPNVSSEAVPAAQQAEGSTTQAAPGASTYTPLGPEWIKGQPVDGGIDFQKQYSPDGHYAYGMHTYILLPMMVGVSLLVLFLLLFVVVRYNRRSNPVPSKTSHNTVIEVIWTAVPVLILVAIAIPSIGLLAAQFKPAPKGAVTLKAIGNQWFWTYEYPDNGGIQLTSNMLKEKDQVEPGQRARTDVDGPRLLAVDQRVVLPVGVPIRLQTTAQDVIHAWAVPAFWIKLDAVPGKINETSFTIEKPGVYFGQCSELCGARHGFMPIVVEAVEPAVFEQWVRAKGGTMPSDAKAAAAANAAAPENTAASAGPVENGTATPAVTNQAATANPAGAGNGQ
jgi:cytochrome c oxidase subunit 2